MKCEGCHSNKYGDTKEEQILFHACNCDKNNIFHPACFEVYRIRKRNGYFVYNKCVGCGQQYQKPLSFNTILENIGLPLNKQLCQIYDREYDSKWYWKFLMDLEFTYFLFFVIFSNQFSWSFPNYGNQFNYVNSNNTKKKYSNYNVVSMLLFTLTNFIVLCLFYNDLLFDNLIYLYYSFGVAIFITDMFAFYHFPNIDTFDTDKIFRYTINFYLQWVFYIVYWLPIQFFVFYKVSQWFPTLLYEYDAIIFGLYIVILLFTFVSLFISQFVYKYMRKLLVSKRINKTIV